MRKLLALIPVVAFTLVFSACDTDTAGPETMTAEGSSAQSLELEASTEVRLNGGGKIADGEYQVNFGGYAQASEGDITVEFVSTSNGDITGGIFEATGVTNGMNVFESDNWDKCIAAANVTYSGAFNGQPGYKLIWRVGDAGKKKDLTADDASDTVRFELFYGANKLYDTDGGDFEATSSCVGTKRTGLDKGNIMLH